MKAQRAKELLEGSLYDFAKALSIVPDACPQPHLEMASVIEAMMPDRAHTTQRKMLFLAPRYSYKTSLVEASVLMQILRDPNISILIQRATRELSMQMLRTIKDHLQSNPAILGIWGDLSQGASKWSESEIVVGSRTRARRDPTILVAGTGVSTAGLHPDAIFVDDIVVRENCDSQQEMDRAWDAIQSYYPMLAPWGTLLVTGTVWSNIDVYRRIRDRNAQDRENGEPPAYGEYIRSVYLTDAQGNQRLFFPERLSEAFLEQARRDLEPRWYASWYLNQPYESGMKPFTDVAFFEGEFEAAPTPNLSTQDRPPFPVTTAVTVDPAMTAHGSSDSFGIVAVAFDADGKWYVLEAREVRKLPSEATLDIQEVVLAYEPEVLVIESAQADAEMVSRLGAWLRDQDFSSRVVSYSALQDERRGLRGKAQRISSLEPLFRSRTIVLRRGACAPLVRQLDQYPSVVHDDVIDALAMARKALTVVRLPPKTLEEYAREWNDEERQDPWHTAIGFDPGRKERRVLSGTWTGPR